MKKALALFLAAAMSCTLLAGCGQEETTPAEDTGTTAAEGSDLVYAVEAGSAGEAAANENGWKTNVVASQADALMEVAFDSVGTKKLMLKAAAQHMKKA